MIHSVAVGSKKIVLSLKFLKTQIMATSKKRIMPRSTINAIGLMEQRVAVGLGRHSHTSCVLPSIPGRIGISFYRRKKVKRKILTGTLSGGCSDTAIFISQRPQILPADISNGNCSNNSWVLHKLRYLDKCITRVG